MTKRVVITDYTFPTVELEQAAAEIAGAEFIACQSKTDEDVIAAVKGADVVAVQFAPFTKDAIAALNPNATIIRYGVGYDNIDIVAAAEANISIGYVPDYCADEVADHTVASILTLLRKLLKLDKSVREGEWAAVQYAQPLKPFFETVIGFYGLGQIGNAVLHRLKGFGFKFIVSDPMLDEATAQGLGVQLCTADELLRQADLISLHAPATDETTGFFNRFHFAMMQPHAMIVNSARGQLVNETDLTNALINGVIAGAALDVFEVEPLPKTSKLLDAPNLLLTPHAAWYSDSAINRLQGLVAQDISRALNGEKPRKPIHTIKQEA